MFGQLGGSIEEDVVLVSCAKTIIFFSVQTDLKVQKMFLKK